MLRTVSGRGKAEGGAGRQRRGRAGRKVRPGTKPRLVCGGQGPCMCSTWTGRAGRRLGSAAVIASPPDPAGGGPCAATPAPAAGALPAKSAAACAARGSGPPGLPVWAHLSGPAGRWQEYVGSQPHPGWHQAAGCGSGAQQGAGEAWRRRMGLLWRPGSTGCGTPSRNLRSVRLHETSIQGRREQKIEPAGECEGH